LRRDRQRHWAAAFCAYHLQVSGGL
jgi:hypothetical protein